MARAAVSRTNVSMGPSSARSARRASSRSLSAWLPLNSTVYSGPSTTRSSTSTRFEAGSQGAVTAVTRASRKPRSRRNARGRLGPVLHRALAIAVALVEVEGLGDSRLPGTRPAPVTRTAPISRGRPAVIDERHAAPVRGRGPRRSGLHAGAQEALAPEEGEHALAGARDGRVVGVALRGQLGGRGDVRAVEAEVARPRRGWPATGGAAADRRASPRRPPPARPRLMASKSPSAQRRSRLSRTAQRESGWPASGPIAARTCSRGSSWGDSRSIAVTTGAAALDR